MYHDVQASYIAYIGNVTSICLPMRIEIVNQSPPIYFRLKVSYRR